MRHRLRTPIAGDPCRVPWARRTPPPMDHGVGGWKDSQYSDTMARIILARIEGGESVQSLLADPAMPSKRTLYDWLEADPDFGDAWREMRADQARARREAVARAEPDRAAREAARARAEGRRPRAKAGRKSTYSEDAALAVCMMLEWGSTLREALAWAGVGSPLTLYSWLRNHPDFRELYVQALRRREHALQTERDVTILCLDWRAGPEGNAPIKSRVDHLQGRIGALRPDVWRWD